MRMRRGGELVFRKMTESSMNGPDHAPGGTEISSDHLLRAAVDSFLFCFSSTFSTLGLMASRVKSLPASLQRGTVFLIPSRARKLKLILPASSELPTATSPRT